VVVLKDIHAFFRMYSSVAKVSRYTAFKPAGKGRIALRLNSGISYNIVIGTNKINKYNL
jgi:hypothetical protein